MQQITEKQLIETLEKNGASYFANLIPENLIKRILRGGYTLFVPINSFYEYLRTAIPESQLNSNTKKHLQTLSLEHLLTNETINEVVTNHIFSNHLRLLKPESSEMITLLSGLQVKYAVSWDRKKSIDEIPIVEFVELGNKQKKGTTRNLSSLQIYFIDGILANERQHEEIMNDPEFPYEISEKTGEPDLSGMNKHERCIYHLKAKNSEWCAANGYKARAVGPDGKTCINPWAVCSRVGE